MKETALAVLVLPVVIVTSSPLCFAQSLTLRITLTQPPPSSPGPIILTIDKSKDEEASAQGAILLDTPGDQLRFGFSLTKLQNQAHGLGLAIQNDGPEALTVPWDQVTLTGPDGLALRTLHRGIRFAQARAPMAASTIPPRSTLADFVFPVDRIAYLPGRGGGWLLLQFFEKLSAGETFSFYVPLQSPARTKGYSFTFRVE
jgi:hypothetical protein